MNLRDWTSYYSVGGVYTEDSRHEDVMVLLEAVRPRDIQKFLQHELDVCPADKVHVSMVNVLKFRTPAACLKGLDKQRRPRSDCFFQKQSDQDLPCLLF